jgi:hypothetical protein
VLLALQDGGGDPLHQGPVSALGQALDRQG